ncbi:substrate-binding domain-containing protein [Humibacter ginsenosidimutans]|uniref:DeoR family transcriptional regulator n=1 Tax=Humibacter ginsenosidimutans TaxID=2599293 RepID=A0A5B8M7W9_9MICO|nr:substrate-binding domain-containing protein [Humibacter ginsenosidimutans]QDZ15755.1 DeoR family transcriptional regulator [Humibacter ginsenosidimutans]
MLLENERHDAILDALNSRSSVRTEDLATTLGVSGMTVRRDLRLLEERGLLRRVHGGAIPVKQQVVEQRPGAGARPRATIGMVTPSGEYYYAAVIAGAKRAARDLGCRLVLGVSDYTEAVELHQVRRLLDLGVDGMLVTPSREFTESVELHKTLMRARVPVVIVERDLGEEPEQGPLESVRSDHAYGARLAVRHLAELGHDSIGLAMRDTPTAPWVRDGFRRALSEFTIDPARCFEHEITRNPDSDSPRRDNLERLLSRCIDTDTHALLVLTDVDAIGLLDLAAERGIRVPDDLSVVAYDDEVASLASVPLTAVAPAKHDLGHLAFSMCFERVGAESSLGASRGRIHLLPALNVRESTAAARPGA